MNRLHTILTTLLVVQLAAAALVRSTGTNAAPTVATSLLPDFDSESIHKIEIFEPGEGEDEAESARLVLEKRGDTWVLASHHDYPVRDGAVRDLLDQLDRMKSTGPLVSGNRESGRLAQLEVAADKYRRRLVLHGANEPSIVWLGSPVGGRRTAVRLGDSQDVHPVREVTSATGSARIGAWFDTAYLSVAKDELSGLRVENEHGLFDYERDENGVWRPAGESPSEGPAAEPVAAADASDLVKPLVTALATLRGARPAALPAAEHTPSVTVTLTVGGDEPTVYTVDVYRHDDETIVHARGREHAVIASTDLSAVMSFNDSP